MNQFNYQDCTARTIETNTLLGPIFSISTFPEDEVCTESFIENASLFALVILSKQPAIAKSYFSDAQMRMQSDIVSSISALRMVLATVHGLQFSIISNLIRAGPVARELVLKHFSLVLAKNAKGGQMRVQRTQVSSDGYITNWICVLLGLCEPFLDIRYSKVSAPGLVD